MTLFAFTTKFGENFYDFSSNSDIAFSDILESNTSENSICQNDEQELYEKLKSCTDKTREIFLDVLIAHFVIKLINSIECYPSDNTNSKHTPVQTIPGSTSNTKYSNENEIKLLVFISHSDCCSNIRKLLIYFTEAGSFTCFNRKKISPHVLRKFPHGYPSTFFFVKFLGLSNFETLREEWKIENFWCLSEWFRDNYPHIFKKYSQEISQEMI